MISEMEKIEFILKKGKKDGMVLSKFIDMQITEFKQSDKYKMMVAGGKYYKNEGDITERDRTYVNDEGAEEIAPHSKVYRLAHPTLYKMINQKTGYLLRKKPTIKQILEKKEQENEKFKKILKDIFNNKMHKLLKRTITEAIKRGISWWQIYVDDEGNLKTRLRYGTRVIPIWKDEEHEILDGLIMFYNVEIYTSENAKEIKEKVEYYDFDGVRYYIRNGQQLVEDVEEVEKRKSFIVSKDEEGTSILAHFLVNDKPQLWKKGIPFIYFKYNDDEMPLIQLLKTLLDCYDELTSKLGEAIFESPEGINVVKNYAAEVESFQKNLQTFCTVFLDKDGDYKREGVKIDISAFKEFALQLRKDIYEGGSGVDTQGEKFATVESGVALKQLFSDLDMDCGNIETECKSSLEYYKHFIDDWAEVTQSEDFSECEAEYIFNKTMTVNEKELIENCNTSLSMISRETALANHPYVDDVEDELAKIKKEQEEEKQQQDNELDKELKKIRNQNNPKVGDE